MASGFSVDKVELRAVLDSDLPAVDKLWRTDDWDFGIDALRFLMDHDVCQHKGFAAVFKEKIIGTGFAFIVNDDIACLGGFFVDKQYRQKGIGPMIWDARMKYIGNRDVHLNALSKRADKDQRLGFKHVLQDIYLMAGMPESRDFNIDEFKSNIDSVIPIKDADLEQLVQYDHTIMKQANRMGYLKTIIQRYNTRGFVATKDGAIVGYVTEMPCTDFVSIGPLYAESPSVGKALLRKFISILPENARVMVAVPETNENSLSAVRAVGLEKVDLARSMTMKKSYEVEWSRIYGIVNIANWLW